MLFRSLERKTKTKHVCKDGKTLILFNVSVAKTDTYLATQNMDIHSSFGHDYQVTAPEEMSSVILGIQEERSP